MILSLMMMLMIKNYCTTTTTTTVMMKVGSGGGNAYEIKKQMMMTRLYNKVLLHFPCSSYSFNFIVRKIKSTSKQDSSVAASDRFCEEIYSL